MTIELKKYDNEAELHNWVERNISSVFGEVIYLPGNFFINTKRNKGGKPDGFLLDLKNSTWTIIESELIEHGVWDHIAEQIIRFIVASKNDSTKRIIRNKFFEKIESESQIGATSKKLDVDNHKLMQYIENILEGNTPEIAIFIDDVNEDLEDMIEALNVTTKVYKVQKYLVNGKVEYLPPEGMTTTIETTNDEVKDVRGNTAEAIEVLGGGKIIPNAGSIKFYELNNGEIISVKYSKFYASDSYYWYGITPSATDKYESQKITHLVFILGNQGLIKLPYGILKEYLVEASTTLNKDKTIRHFHILIKENPKMIYTSKDKKSFDVEEYYYGFG